MTWLIRRLRDFRLPGWSMPIALLAVGVAAYGLLIPWLGFYWDDWAFTWISAKLGAEGLARYFSTNRPVWGVFYQITTSILDSVPWQWQVFSLFWRWLAALNIWWLVRLLWPRRQLLAVTTALLFLVYPGFDQQFIAITYGHFWLIFCAFVLSLSLTVLSVRSPARRWHFAVPALLLSAVNLFSMEYFFLLELFRVVVIWAALPFEDLTLSERAEYTPKHAWPYMGVFAAATIWRAFLFPYQNQNYETSLLSGLLAQPVQTVLGLVSAVAADIYKAAVAAWAQPFTLPDTSVLGERSLLLYAALMLAVAFGVWAFLYFLHTERGQASQRWQVLLVALAGLLLAGWPLWLTGLQVGLIFPGSRFTIPFMLGASLLLAGLIDLIPGPRALRIAVVAVLVSASVGYQFRVANDYRRDWDLQKALFWQMSWRMPSIEPGTVLLSNDLPSGHVSDNSLTSPLNFIYAPENYSQEMAYMLYYPTVRLERALQTLESGSDIHQNYLAAEFDGSTSQVVAFVYEPPGCLRVLDPELDAENRLLPGLLRDAARISRPELIQPAEGEFAAVPPAGIFGAEPAQRWCYYYESAALAAGQEDWQQVAEYAETAFNLGDYPNAPLERVPFIEGYAHTGDWPRALELTRETADITPLARPVLCQLWQRIERETDPGDAQFEAINTAKDMLGCGD